MKHIRRYQKFILIALVTNIVIINLVGYLGAYGLTTYRQGSKFGWGYDRLENNKTPADFELIYTHNRLKLNNQEWIETWLVESPEITAKGTVILFHGKNSTKSSLLASARVFHRLGYRSLLVDFRGSGGSSGNVTTIGVNESQDVALVTNYVQKENPDSPIILYGISMGSGAILRAIAKENIEPDGIILELPFTSLLSAVKLRLNRANIPAFPLGELIVFWGGVQNGFNGFAHQPIDDAIKVNCSTLILYGDLDDTVELSEIKKLAQNINSTKKLVNFPQAGHQILVTVNSQLWQQSVQNFLVQINND